MTLNPGRKLDALVATRVMGWKPWASGYNKEPDCWATGKTGDDESPTVRISGWRPSEDIAAAWEVAERLPKRASIIRASKGWMVVIGRDLDVVSAEAPTAPHAICLAALRAVGGEGE